MPHNHSYPNTEEFLDEHTPSPNAIYRAKDLLKATESITEMLLAVLIVYEGVAEDDGPEHLYLAIQQFADWERKNL